MLLISSDAYIYKRYKTIIIMLISQCFFWQWANCSPDPNGLYPKYQNNQRNHLLVGCWCNLPKWVLVDFWYSALLPSAKCSFIVAKTFKSHLLIFCTFCPMAFLLAVATFRFNLALSNPLLESAYQNWLTHVWWEVLFFFLYLDCLPMLTYK